MTDEQWPTRKTAKQYLISDMSVHLKRSITDSVRFIWPTTTCRLTSQTGTHRKTEEQEGSRVRQREVYRLVSKFGAPWSVWFDALTEHGGGGGRAVMKSVR